MSKQIMDLALRSLTFAAWRPLDMETPHQSVKKTNRVLVVKEDNLTGGWEMKWPRGLGTSSSITWMHQ